MSFPNLVIAGTPKSGTTSLFSWLSEHQNVVHSRVKETYYLMDSESPFFCRDSNYLSNGLEGYSALFPAYTPDQICIEATPDYMYQATALKVLSSLPTHPIIVFLLRDPTERILSLHRFARNNVGSLNHDMSVSEFVSRLLSGSLNKDEILNNALLHGKYHTWLQVWFQECGRERVKVFFFDDMVNDPLKFMKHFCAEIGIASYFYETFNFLPKNRSRQIRSSKLLQLRNSIKRRVPSLVARAGILKKIFEVINTSKLDEKTEHCYSDHDIHILRNYYDEPNRKLASLLEKKLPAAWGKPAEAG